MDYYQSPSECHSVLQHHPHSREHFFHQVGVIEYRLAHKDYLAARAQFLFCLEMVQSHYQEIMANNSWHRMSLHKMLFIHARLVPLHRLEQLHVGLLRRLVRGLHPGSARQDYVALYGHYDVGPVHQELQQIEPMWTLNESRQQQPGSPHRHTQSIVLFNKSIYNVSLWDSEEQAWRYAMKHSVLDDLPHLGSIIRQFEQDMGGVLGRVSLVRLRPHSVITGHCDTESQLRGFDRFHLVINSSDGSYMQVNDQYQVFGEGDLFFFENKRWHTAYNTSSDWRIHVIIDIRLPQERSRSLSVYSYADWKKWG